MITGNELIEYYIDWLKKEISITKFEDTIELTLPFLDAHNDYIQIYINQVDDNIILSDDGNTLNELRMSGCEFYNKNIDNILHKTGIKLISDNFCVEANKNNFPQKMQALIQAILSVNNIITFY
jgi:hypothetical protein